ncbi:MAG: thioredoxin family protein [Candidatus Heimdallarchaeota archaeon]|nr:thioredoxin family protein [Candidatus Heimdallarchaeota archaeon]
MLEKISKEFFESGITFDEFLKEGTEDEAKRTQLYYSKSAKNFTPEELRIDIEHPINLMLVATTWCWDSQTNVPVIVHLANHNPKINLRIFNKDNYPFLADKINGGEKVPQLLFYTKDFYYLDRWVERSTPGYKLYAELRKQYGWKEENKPEFIKQYRKEFLRQQKNLEHAVFDEIHAILKRADEIQKSTSRFA